MTSMTNTSQIPTPAHTLADSMLSRRFGRETVNYFSSMARCDMKRQSRRRSKAQSD